MNRHLSLSILAMAAAAVSNACACDLCGCYTPEFNAAADHQHEEYATGLYAAVSEQFTHFGTMQFEGQQVPNEVDQQLDSSITQLVAGYNFNPRIGVQLNLPLIYRAFRRPDGFKIDKGTESGIGDVSLLGRFVAFHKEVGGERELKFDDPKSPHWETREPSFVFSAVVFGGIKLPTGDSSRIREEFHESETPGAPESGIHGHDLALGSGSVDGIVGCQCAMRYRNAFADAIVQYTIRSEGDFGYRYANDLSWSGGPGYYFIRRPRMRVGCQCAVSGEHKGRDEFRGATAEDTGLTTTFVGPRIVGSLGRWSAEIAADIPVNIDNSALQIVPDYRLRGGIAVQF